MKYLIRKWQLRFGISNCQMKKEDEDAIELIEDKGEIS